MLNVMQIKDGQLVHLRSPTQDPARPFSQPGGKLPVPRDACDININRSKDHHKHQLGGRLPVPRDACQVA